MRLPAIVRKRHRRRAAIEATDAAERQASPLRRQDRFLHGAAHELRTPVTIARGHLEALRGFDSHAPELAIALDELARMDGILERLLLLAGAVNTDVLAPEALELRPFLEEVFLRWSELAPRAWRLGEAPSHVMRADPHALRVALDALLENAVKHTRTGAAIELSAHRQRRATVIEVSNEGGGVPRERLDQIFEPFGRSDAGRSRAQGGVGLGLAIVDAITKAHGGRCTVRTSEAGSTFALQLPHRRPWRTMRRPE